MKKGLTGFRHRSPKSNQTRGVLSRRGVAITLSMSLALLGLLSFFAKITDHFPSDLTASLWIQSWRTHSLDTFLEGVSTLGNALPAGILAAALVSLLVLMRKATEGAILGLAVLVVYVTSNVLKLMIDRPRPSSDLVQVIGDASGYSFPSTHSMFITVLLGFLGLLVVMHVRPKWLKGSLLSLGLALLLLMGISRIYLGVHWLSDVVGGYLFGLAILMASLLLRRWWMEKVRNRASKG